MEKEGNKKSSYKSALEKGDMEEQKFSEIINSPSDQEDKNFIVILPKNKKLQSTFVIGDKLVGRGNSVHFSDNMRRKDTMKKARKPVTDLPEMINHANQ